MATVQLGILVSLGCSNNDGAAVDLPPKPSTDITVPTAVTPSPADETAEVRRTYVESVALLDRADTLPEGTRRQRLAQYLTDPQLSRILDRIKDLHAENLTSYGASVPHIKSVKVEGDKATVHDCQDSSNSGLMDATTQRKINRGVKEESIKALMQKHSDGRWRISKFVVLGEGC
ncbi:hypothetical protein [Thermomonospora cellulosilytica]|uniref:Secreted protein/lipoprotein n=1 Tax=Thermomonospora cellulosilytica TaxID=1411118 RepID=A0A7W3MW77_9ACTN|nr:hypothetical protein [Thermomonospora cellulosilytica]MBA9003055.1 hypothetical protein [Thermomonospora cellulosilytica]